MTALGEDPVPLAVDAVPLAVDAVPLADDAVPLADDAVPLGDDPPPLIAIATAYGVHELARRQPQNPQIQRTIRALYTINSYPNRVERFRNMIPVQEAWKSYLQNIYNLFSEQFWSFFVPLHTCETVAIDKALWGAKHTFMTQGTAPWKRFPSSKRVVFETIKKKVPPFWPKVRHSTTIDLSHFALPSTKSVQFNFIDPLWGWLIAARKQNPLDMHWKAVQQGSRPVYGAGVQYGKAFLEACRSCPEGQYPMCFSLHWDGTGAHGIESTPICIGVLNTNSSSADTHFCLGYMPRTPDTNSVVDSTKVSRCVHILYYYHAYAQVASMRTRK